MDDDAKSDEEVEILRQGLLAVKIPSELKQRIRKPWASTFIVKVYGRTVGLNFIQARLLAIWKLAGRLDCVDLGHGFFLTRLSLGEDYENVLRKGPLFIREHFLSIRPWKPDFKPTLANVSSIAVWIRLNELPIKYYNAEVLQLIGRAIGNVLQVDTFTVSEIRGRFARLCVQVDVEKPLATAIMIGRLEQQISYEGIQKMCFECGCLGHRKEYCPHVVRQGPSASKAEVKEAGATCSSSRSAHVPDEARNGEGTTGVLHVTEQNTEQEDVREGVYGPWVVIARKKGSTKPLRSGGTLPRQGSGISIKNTKHVENGSTDRAAALDGITRETKRKLAPQKFLDKAQISSVLQSFRQEGKFQAQQSPTRMLKTSETSHTLFQPKPAQNSLRLSSVKGKKGAARNRVISGEQGSAMGVQSSNCNGSSLSQVSVDLVGNDGQRINCVGQHKIGSADGLQFTAGTRSTRSEAREMGFYPDQGVSKVEPKIGVLQPLTQESMKGEQAGVGEGVDHRGFVLGDDFIIEGQAAGGASTSDISNFSVMKCEANEEVL
nr:hypothetical protein CFP56_74206 [Quercus suber]